ncbi:T9SS type A sorting domain-containing protein [Candidatus Caldipriscus sp.]|nr:T9SS type A sorting domain-containing protein [Candidatus Caldipriscus sp.]
MKGYLLRTFALWVRGLLALLSVSLVALFTEYAHAVTFARTYGGISDDYASSVQRTPDGGYIVAGYTDSFGAGSDNIFLIKTDANGNVQWAKTYGGTNNDYAYSFQQTSDGGYIVAGRTNSFGAGVYDPFLIKTDANGNLQWAKTYGRTGWDEAYSVQQTSDGGYIVAGYTDSFGAGYEDIFLIKTDANGDVQWAKAYGGTSVDVAYSVQQTSDGGYIVAGYTASFGAGGYDIFLIKTDANGNVIWAKTYGGTDWDVAHSVQQTSDGGYIVAGYTDSFGAGGYDIFLIKTDANGNVIWAKTYGGIDYERASSVQQTSDGGYIVAGITGSFGAVNWDVFLIKTDTNGNIIWAKTYGGAGLDVAYSVQQTSDGGYIVAGGTQSFGAGYYDAFLVKTDANGNIGSCSIVQNVTPTVITPSPTVNTPSPSVSFPSIVINSISPTIAFPTLTVSEPCPLSISESCQIASSIITPYKGGIKITKSGEFEVKVYNVSGVMVKSVKGKDEVKIDLSRGVYFVDVVSGGKVIREKVVIR